jgi:hypothetical protein
MAAGESSYPYPDEPIIDLEPETAESERRKRYAWLYDDEDIWAAL